MEDLSTRLIRKAPALLVTVALAFLVGGLLNLIPSYRMYAQSTEYSGSGIAFLWGSLFGVLYQPTLLLAWAAAVHWLSVIAEGRRA